MLNFNLNECINKVVFINVYECDDKNIEFIKINNINDYNYLDNYINNLINNNIDYDYFIYN